MSETDVIVDAIMHSVYEHPVRVQITPIERVR